MSDIFFSKNMVLFYIGYKNSSQYLRQTFDMMTQIIDSFAISY